MARIRFTLGLLGAGLLLPITAVSQPNVPLSSRVTQPKLVPLAETSLLMEGMAQANFRGLEKILSEKPNTPERWKFARGQALLIAETGNLLMLRPPKNQGQDEWMKASVAMRDAAERLAKQTALQDWQRSRGALTELATSCNRCHETFRVKTRISAFRDEEK